MKTPKKLFFFFGFRFCFSKSIIRSDTRPGMAFPLGPIHRQVAPDWDAANAIVFDDDATMMGGSQPATDASDIKTPHVPLG